MAGGGVFREDLGKEMNSKQKKKTTITVLTAGATTKQTRQETPHPPPHPTSCLQLITCKLKCGETLKVFFKHYLCLNFIGNAAFLEINFCLKRGICATRDLFW